jgi:hypothetical protein
MSVHPQSQVVWRAPAIVAHNATRSDLQSRVNADPFVAEGVVNPEILEFTPSQAEARLNFLLA